MTPNEYLDETKKALGIESDYELAKRMEIPTSYLPTMRSGKRHVPIDVAFKIAITLNLDPARVVADLESQRKGNSKQGEFWRGFLLRVTMAAVLACTLAFNFSATQGREAARLGGRNRRFYFA